MSKRQWLSAGVCVLAVLLLLFFVGRDWLPLGDQGGTAGNYSSDGENSSHTTLPPPKPLLDGWQKPAVALVLSGEQHGFIEPCGCSETQSGGMSRRADLLRQIDERGWPVAAFDLGGTVRRTRLQSKFKFQTIVEALKEMNYSALALGLEELRLEQSDPGYLISQHMTDPDDSQKGLSFLAANVVFFDNPEFGTPLHSKLVEVDNVKIGVTAIFGTELIKQVLPEGAQSEITIQDPAESLPPVIEELKQREPDLLVLLSHANMEESRSLAAAFPDFDLVLTAGGPEDGIEHAEHIGKTQLVSVGQKGKHVGVVGFYPGDPQQRVRFELVDLDNQRFADTPRMNDLMREYQTMLANNRVDVFKDLPKASHPRDATFAGAAKCGECHTKAYNLWKTGTRHHHAYDSLIKGRKGQEETWVSRINDPECLCCHVTGWHPQDVYRYDSGFESLQDTPHLEAQQCENCHGPGSKHVELEWNFRKDQNQADQEELRKERGTMKVSLEEAKQRVCYSCHDLDNSPKFNFDDYWPKIRHPWRD